MKLLLTRFSQEVDFGNLDRESNFLIFTEEGTGETIRLPVPKETILELVRLTQAVEPPEAPSEPELVEDPDQGAEVFEEQELGEEGEEIFPDSEGDVPSI